MTCAENYTQSNILGRQFSMLTLIVAKIILDTILSGWRAAIFGGHTTPLLVPLILISLSLYVPGTKVFVYFQLHKSKQLRKSKVAKFIDNGRRKLAKRMEKPLPLTILLVFTALCIFLSEDLIRDSQLWQWPTWLWEFPESGYSWPSIRTLSLLAIPVASPVAYYFVKSARQRAELWLERMTKSSG